MTVAANSSTEHGEAGTSVASTVSRREQLFRLGLRAESHARDLQPQVKLPPPDQQIVYWADRLKSKIASAFGLVDPEATLPHGARFALLKLSGEVPPRAPELLAYMREHPHLNADFMLRLAQDPRPDKHQFVVCVTPRYLSTAKGVKFFVRGDMLESDKSTLESLCVDLEGSDNSLQIWFSTESMPLEAYLKVVDLADELRENFPGLGDNPAGVTVHAPIEIEHRLPEKLILVRETTVLLRKLLSSNPRAQEESEIEQIRAKLTQVARDFDGPAQVVVVIQRTVLSPYTIRMLKQFRTHPDNVGLLTIRAMTAVRQRYPELFQVADHRRKIVPVRPEDLAYTAEARDAEPRSGRQVVPTAPLPGDGHATTVAMVVNDKVIVTDTSTQSQRDRSGSLLEISQQIEQARREERERLNQARKPATGWWNPLGWMRRPTKGGRSGGDHDGQPPHHPEAKSA